MSQITTENDKNRKIPNFYQFYEIFAELLLDFVDQRVENAQHGTNSLHSRLLRRDNCSFLNEKGLKLTPKLTKNPKISIFNFFAVFNKFSTDFVDWKNEKGQHGNHVLSSMLSEEIHAVFQLKTVWK